MLLLLFVWMCCASSFVTKFPAVVQTWAGEMEMAAASAYDTLVKTNDPVEAVVAGGLICQQRQCDHTVGYGGSPDESGDTTLDAMVMDGTTYRVGAVGYMRGVKNAIGVAREVMRRTEITFLAGLAAAQFAKQMGFEVLPNLEDAYSKKIFEDWKAQNCQPNYWRQGQVSPDPSSSCGPYSPINNGTGLTPKTTCDVHQKNHDTISIIAINSEGKIATGVTTNGLNHKIVGRIGDSPIPGAGGILFSLCSFLLLQVLLLFCRYGGFGSWRMWRNG